MFNRFVSYRKLNQIWPKLGKSHKLHCNESVNGRINELGDETYDLEILIKFFCFFSYFIKYILYMDLYFN